MGLEVFAKFTRGSTDPSGLLEWNRVRVFFVESQDSSAEKSPKNADQRDGRSGTEQHGKGQLTRFSMTKSGLSQGGLNSDP